MTEHAGQDDVSTRLGQRLAELKEYPVFDDGRLGEILLGVARAVTPAERQCRLTRLRVRDLGFDLKIAIICHNNELIRAAGIWGVRSDAFGTLQYATPGLGSYIGSGPEGLRSILDRRNAVDYLMRYLLRAGALPVPKTKICEIIADLGLQAFAPQSSDSTMDGLTDTVQEVLPGFHVASDREIGMMFSGEGSIPECLQQVIEYATAHPDEIDDTIREIWHAETIAWDPFLCDEERGSRAKLYASIQKLLRENGDSHPISIAYRGQDFFQRILPVLLVIGGHITGFNTKGRA